MFCDYTTSIAHLNLINFHMGGHDTHVFIVPWFVSWNPALKLFSVLTATIVCSHAGLNRDSITVKLVEVIGCHLNYMLNYTCVTYTPCYLLHDKELFITHTHHTAI